MTVRFFRFTTLSLSGNTARNEIHTSLTSLMLKAFAIKNSSLLLMRTQCSSIKLAISLREDSSTCGHQYLDRIISTSGSSLTRLELPSEHVDVVSPLISSPTRLWQLRYPSLLTQKMSLLPSRPSLLQICLGSSSNCLRRLYWSHLHLMKTPT